LKLDKYIPDAIVRLNKYKINSNKELVVKINTADTSKGEVIIIDSQEGGS